MVLNLLKIKNKKHSIASSKIQYQKSSECTRVSGETFLFLI